MRATRPGLRSLRNVRELKEGMLLTVEPGCYFIESEIRKALDDPAKAQFINADRARSMIGKVRAQSESAPVHGMAARVGCAAAAITRVCGAGRREARG